MKTSMKTYNSLSSPMKKRMNNNRKLINTFGPVRASLGLRAVSYIRVGERKVKEEGQDRLFYSKLRKQSAKDMEK